MTRNSNLLKALHKMKFQKPTEFQERVLPILLSKPYPLPLNSVIDFSSPRNMIGQSHSGTGKTAAFVITMLSRMDYKLKSVQAICLAPTRELALQIASVAGKMSEFTSLHIGIAVRDSVKIKGCFVVVGTVGTVLTLLSDHCIDMRTVNVFVIDEADKMLQETREGCIRVRKFPFFIERRD
jgi:ATP-dependent RNA helicase DDX19/DBP5